ncbi:MAG: Crp/Fnr family transcriptional regulator [Bacteroidetes bacterium]|nr:MAG: Crp/Fnr family transcriptional regulator [Bacteroidota bacterium]
MKSTLERSQIPLCEKCKNLNNSSFCILNRTEQERLSQYKTYNVYKKGQVVFYEGNQPQGLYCIYSGKVKIHKLGDDGKDQIVRLAKTGNVIGYRALLSADNYYATATTLENTVICFFPKAVYLNLLMSNSEFSMKTIKMLSGNLRIAEQMITNMAQKQVKERMAGALIYLIDFFGLEEDHATINTVLTRQDIGNIAGTTTETSIRVLSDLNKNRIIKLSGKKIRIQNYNELLRVANISA